MNEIAGRELGNTLSVNFSQQEHEKSLRSKRQEQKKWEELNLRQEPSFDGRMSMDSTSAAYLRASGSVQQRTASLDYRQPSFDLPLLPQRDLPTLESDDDI